MSDLRITNLSVSYGRHRVLDGFEVDAPCGNITAVVGRNGAGKTTLFRTLMGFQQPDEGTCTVGDLPLQDYMRTHGIGYVPEVLIFPPGWTVEDVMRAGAELVSGSGRSSAELAAEALDRGMFDDRTSRTPVRECSKGNQQRVKLAFAMMGDPRILLLDEPFSGLDPASRLQIRELVEQCRARGAAVVFASHELAEVARLSDGIYHLARGRTTRVEPAASGSGYSLEDLEARFMNGGGE